MFFMSFPSGSVGPMVLALYLSDASYLICTCGGAYVVVTTVDYTSAIAWLFISQRMVVAAGQTQIKAELLSAMWHCEVMGFDMVVVRLFYLLCLALSK